MPRKKKRRGNKGGRPSKLTPEITKRICDLVRAGNYLEVAAAVCGINKDTLFEWLKRGARSSRGPYKRFSDSVDIALAEAEINDVNALDKAANADWRVPAWRLERKHPTRWGRMDRQEISGPGGGPVLTESKATVSLGIPMETLNEIAKARAEYEAQKRIEQNPPEQPAAS